MSAILTRPLSRTINAALRRTIGRNSTAAAPISYDPADLPWNSGAKRFWWHFDDGGMFKAADGGGGGATVFGDAVASLQSGSGTGTYWLNQAGATSGVRRNSGVELPYLAHFEGSLGSQDDSVTGGFTFGFCGYISSGTFSSNLLCVGGADFSPKDHTLVINYNSVEVAAWTSAAHGETIDWTVPHRIIGTGEYVGSTVTGRLYIDGVLVKTQTGLTAGSWSRDLLYPNNSSIVWNMRSRFVAAQAFTDEDDIALIDRYLCLGSNPLIPTGGWSAWLASQKAAWLDYGYNDDMTRLWQDDAATTPVSAAGQAVGAWRGQKDALTLIQATAGNRPEYQTRGVLFDSTTADKILAASLSLAATDPALVGATRLQPTSGAWPIKAGLFSAADATSIITGISQFNGGHRARVRGTNTTVSSSGGGLRSNVLAFDGTNAKATYTNGPALLTCTVGSSATAISHFVIAASGAGATKEISNVKTWVVSTMAPADDDLVFITYWMKYRSHLE